MTGLRVRALVALAGCGCVMALAGCDQMTNPTYDVTSLGCEVVSEEMLDELQSKITADGQLRHPKQVESRSGTTFVSAELALTGEDPHTKGDILTWDAQEDGSLSFASVDVNARHDSAWPDSTLDVTAPGARESRACVDPSRGKTTARVECEQAQDNVGVPAGGQCEDL